MRGGIIASVMLAALSAGSGLSGYGSQSIDLYRVARQAGQQANGPATPDKTAVSPTGDIDRRTTRQQRGTGYPHRGWPGIGWSVAQDRRNARKARNVKRHRKACK